MVERCGRWARKNRTLVSTAVAAGIVALITLGSTSVLLSRKNQEIAAKNDEVVEQRDRAEQNLKLARGAVRDLLANLSEDPRLEAAGLDSLRLKLAEKATPYFQEFLEATPDDEEVAFEQVELRRTLGEISFQASSQETAHNYFKAISDSLDQLLASNPHSEISLTYRQIMARTQDRLGILHSYWGEADLAQSHFERALAIAAALPSASKERVLDKYGSKPLLTSSALTNMATLQVSAGELDLAEKYLASSMEILASDDRFQNSRQMLNASRILATISTLRGDYSEAEERLWDIVEAINEVPDKQVGFAGASEIQRRNFKAEVLNEIGTLLVTQSKPLAAMDVFQQAMDLAEETRKRFPENLLAIEILGTSLNNLSIPSHSLINRKEEIEELERRENQLLIDALENTNSQTAINPKSFTNRLNALITQKNIAHSLKNDGQPKESREMLEKIIESLRNMLDDHPHSWRLREQLTWALLFNADAISFDRNAWDLSRKHIREAVTIAEAEYERTGIVEFLNIAQQGYWREAQLSSGALLPNWNEILQFHESRLAVLDKAKHIEGANWDVYRAYAYEFLGDTQTNAGDIEAANYALDQAIDSIESAIEKSPEEPNFRMQRFLLGLKRIDAKSESGFDSPFEIAAQLYEEAKYLEDVDPKWIRTDIFETLVDTYVKMAEQEGANERYDQQKRKLESSIRILDELYLRRKQKKDLLTKAELQIELAMATFGVGDEQRFIPLLAEARDTIKRYMELQPRSQRARELLGMTFIRGGEFYTLKKDFSNAFRQYDQAVDAESRELFNKSRIYRAKSTVHQGNYLTALDDVRRLQAVERLTTDEVFDVAAIYGAAYEKVLHEQEQEPSETESAFTNSLIDRLLDEAITKLEECLTRAARAGTSAQPYIEFALESDDFVMLRETEAFQQLIEEFKQGA